MGTLRWLAVLGGLWLLAGCGSTPEVSQPVLGGHYKIGKPYQVAGRWYYPAYDPTYAVEGVASWYGDAFQGRPTANGEVFDRHQISAAHPTLPLPSIVRVTNLANHRQLELRVNDRGPFVGERVIDLSQAAARALGFERRGTTPVRVEFVRLADPPGAPPRTMVAQARASAPQAPAPVAVARQEVRAAPPRPAVRRDQPIRPTAVEPAAVEPAAVEPAAAPVALASAAGGAGAWARDLRCPTGGFIQVGAFVESDRAVRLARELDAAVLVPVSADLPSTDRYARVRLGPIVDHQQAEDTLRWLRQTGHANAFWVRPDAAAAVSC